VVLEASYALYNRAFSYNFCTILLYAVVVSPLPLLNASIIFGMFMVKSCKSLPVSFTLSSIVIIYITKFVLVSGDNIQYIHNR